MSAELENILRTSEVRPFVENRRRLDATQVPDFFQWITAVFPGTNTFSSIEGKLGERYPAVSLEGFWKNWEVLAKGSQKLITTRHIVSVGLAADGPLVTVTGMYEEMVGNVLVDRGSNTRRVKQRMIDSLPLLEVVEREIEGTQLLNPNGEEIDIFSLREKAKELESVHQNP